MLQPIVLPNWRRYTLAIRSAGLAIWISRRQLLTRLQIRKFKSSADIELGPVTWSADIKAADHVLDPIFKKFYTETREPMLFRKADHHGLVQFIQPHAVDPEAIEKLDHVLAVAERARPL